MKIFDVHTHVGTFFATDGSSVEEMIAELKSFGISKTVSSPGPLADSAEKLIAGNREALTLREKYPDFYYPGCIVNPLFPEESLQCLAEFRECGLVWAGEWCSYCSNIDFDKNEWKPFFEFCAEHDMVVQLHNHPAVAEVAKRYDSLTIVASHLNQDVLPLLVDLQNVYVDISGMHGGLCRNTLIKARRMFGYERLLFGSDYPGYDALPFVIRTRRDFLPEELEMVFSGNLGKIMAAHGVEL